MDGLRRLVRHGRLPSRGACPGRDDAASEARAQTPCLGRYHLQLGEERFVSVLFLRASGERWFPVRSRDPSPSDGPAVAPPPTHPPPLDRTGGAFTANSEKRGS